MAHSRHNIEQATNGFVVALYVASALFLAVAGYFLLRAAKTEPPSQPQGYSLPAPSAPAPLDASPAPPVLPLT
jgi:hypothetical protein